MTGAFAFEVTEFNGRTWRLLALFGGAGAGAEPDATIRTDAQTYSEILARKLSAPEAYFSGRITISGDAGRGMQVGLALLPKF
jgi:predicted lipid carrier protein YhbT